MNKRNLVIAAVVVLVIGGLWVTLGRAKKKDASLKETKPFYGHIERSITATGTVQPQNRLEVKPPIGGRIDKILVEEGQNVKVGDVLALMSSTDRATLLDAAKLQGSETLKKWEDVYKPIPLLAPIDGEVIVKAVDPGQVVTPSDAVIVLSDRLIVQAQVDETDIGKVKLGQEAVITLDAYPDLVAKSKVDHVYYESTTVNNVTIYKVDILPEKVPDEFRSGMSANVKIVQESKDNALLVPLDTVKQKNGKSFVLVSEGAGEKPDKREVGTGLSDDNNIEITSGLTADDTIVEQVTKFSLPKSQTTGTNPFMPSRRGGGGGGH
jgi:macrolide-specific efflux system membrane fusion protein